jgi:hypothetical protein
MGMLEKKRNEKLGAVPMKTEQERLEQIEKATVKAFDAGVRAVFGKPLDKLDSETKETLKLLRDVLVYVATNKPVTEEDAERFQNAGITKAEAGKPLPDMSFDFGDHSEKFLNAFNKALSSDLKKAIKAEMDGTQIVVTYIGPKKAADISFDES